ncbi:YjbE family integral membrane protein [Anaerospora hongkongensis]|uniref:YjbE family integral membrane protein n=1 Tax=Anaerospora hongkongensis TaxID=244830 RepID=A0A4R1PXC4_9FIRM|nr:TerC family protein [Anaerospora hongkongensis]TCL36444.1 YjbE family integral membrane protein [Anaerospora hongkongensis]
MELLAALGSITFINLILSGDNAVIIALASRNLPPEQRKKAVLWGSAGAVVLRIVLTMIAALLLQIPYVQFVGGLALLWIAVSLLGEEKKHDVACKEAASFTEAIKVILFADLIMSLDNVLAIAGVANGNMILLIAGLAMSVPLVVFGSQMLMSLMDRYPIIIYIGAAILGWTASKMMVADAAMGPILEAYALPLEIALTVTVVGIGHWLKQRSHSVAADTEGAPAFRDSEK